MSEQEKNTGSKRKFIVGSGIAAAAAVVIVAQYGFDFSGTDNAAGTIAPAQRYRATQNTGGDVKTGNNPGQQTGGTPVTNQTGPAVVNQGLNNQGLNNQRLDNQNLNNQNLSNQNLSNQNLNNQNLNNQNLNNQNLNNQNLNNQNLNNQNLNNQNLNNQSLNNQGK